MPRQSILEMPFSKVYPCLVQKAVRKGRTKAEVDQIIVWLTGYHDPEAASGVSCRTFFENAPSRNPKSETIRGTICGVRVEQIEDPLMKRIRQLDRLVDELAKGRSMEKTLRETDEI